MSIAAAILGNICLAVMFWPARACTRAVLLKIAVALAAFNATVYGLRAITEGGIWRWLSMGAWIFVSIVSLLRAKQRSIECEYIRKFGNDGRKQS